MPEQAGGPQAADGTPIFVPPADGAPAGAGGDPPAPPANDPPVRSDDEIAALAAQANNPDAVSNAMRAERERTLAARRERDAALAGQAPDPEAATRALEAERARTQNALARIAEMERAGMSEQERLQAERDELRGQVPSLQGENLRLRVALEKGVPADLIDRLRGDTKEDLERDAEDLMARLNPQPEQPPEFHGGARPREAVAGGSSFDDVIRRQAAARR